MNAEAYAAQLTALLPRGKLWESLATMLPWQRLLLAFGDGLARFHAAVLERTVEADPRTTSELLPEWEATVGLPDHCLPNGGSTEQRREAVVARLVATGGSSVAYFTELADAYGYAITIDYPALHTFRVTTPAETSLVNMTCNGTCNDALQSFGNEQLECLLTRVKPAHTAILFAYGP
ncbi:YmfQ family protein [Hydrocarboniphaga effusa]|uniref:YmfQ family protein n=1 Tax=Hydrocarboniphaga effusa TaxID=243629 RepID=UPI003BA97CB6